MFHEKCFNGKSIAVRVPLWQKKKILRLTYNGKRRHWVHLFTIQNEALDQEFPTKGASIDEMNF